MPDDIDNTITEPVSIDVLEKHASRAENLPSDWVCAICSEVENGDDANSERTDEEKQNYTVYNLRCDHSYHSLCIRKALTNKEECLEK